LRDFEISTHYLVSPPLLDADGRGSYTTFGNPLLNKQTTPPVEFSSV